MASRLAPSTLLGEGYRAVRSIRTDFYGTVWLAERNQDVVWVRATELPSKARLDSLLTAIGALARIASPRICVPRHALHHEDLDVVLITTPALPGIQVSEFLNGGRLAQEDVLALGLGLCRVLEHAHSEGAVHGDLRPEVIFVEEGDPVAFSLSGFENLRLSAAGLGIDPLSFLWFAPERLDAPLLADKASDIFSLSALLISLLAGKPLFASEVAFKTWAASKGPYPPVEGVMDAVPDGLRAVFMKALHRDREERYASCAALADALQPFAREARAMVSSVHKSLGDDDVTQVAEATPHVTKVSALAPGVTNLTGLKREVSKLARSMSGGGLSFSGEEGGQRNFSPERLEGSVIDKRYTLRRLLGVGGMGVVYEAEGPTKERVAVKLILPGSAGGKTALKRFIREAQGAMAIRSEHVVQVFETGTDSALGAPFIVMELLSGTDLSKVIKTQGALEPKVATRIFVEACEGLSAAHSLGIIHRDIKPANIFLHEKEDGRIVTKVCDFGIAKQLIPLPDATAKEHTATELTHTGGILGSPVYMSPEQTRDPKSVDARTDIWSLAISLYKTLAGQQPWEDCTNVAQIVLSIHTTDVTPIQDIAPWVHPDLAAAIHHGLQRDLDQRWGTVDEFRNALLPFAAPSLTLDSLTSVSKESQAFVARRYEGAFVTSATQASTAVDVTSRTTEGLRRSRRAVFAIAMASIVAAGIGLRYFAQQRASTRPSEVACLKKADCSGLGANYACIAGICRTGECGTNLDCISSHDGKPFMCRASDATCVGLETEDCKATSDKAVLENDATIWIGSMFPLTGQDAKAFGTDSSQAVELARQDFMKVASGLPSTREGGTTRPIGIVACNDEIDPARAAKHLVNTVRVPAVIGFRSGKELMDLSSSLFLPHGVLALSSLNRKALVTTVPQQPGQPRLVYRTAVSTGQLATAVATVVTSYLEPTLRAQPGAIGHDGQMRIALVRPESSSGQELSAALRKGLQSGRLGSEPTDAFREFAYSEDGEGKADYERAIAELAEFAPHAIVLDGDTNSLGHWVGPLEARFSMSRANRPYYLLTSAPDGEDVGGFVGSDKGKENRILAVSANMTSPANLKFTMRYNAAFGTSFAASVSPVQAYDAFYLLMYAAYAANEPFTGVGLAQSFKRLIPEGKPIEVGPTAILDAFSLLRNGQNIDLDGGSGTLDFDLETGEAPIDFDITCVRYDKKAKRVESVRSGLFFAARKRSLSGTFNCR